MFALLCNKKINFLYKILWPTLIRVCLHTICKNTGIKLKSSQWFYSLVKLGPLLKFQCASLFKHCTSLRGTQNNTRLNSTAFHLLKHRKAEVYVCPLLEIFCVEENHRRVLCKTPTCLFGGLVNTAERASSLPGMSEHGRCWEFPSLAK